MSIRKSELDAYHKMATSLDNRDKVFHIMKQDFEDQGKPVPYDEVVKTMKPVDKQQEEAFTNKLKEQYELYKKLGPWTNQKDVVDKIIASARKAGKNKA